MTVQPQQPHHVQSSFDLSAAGARDARQWLREKLVGLDVAPETIMGFEVSLAELSANLIDHLAPKPDTFQVDIFADSNAVSVRVLSRSRSFADPDEFRRLLGRGVADVLSERGRGLMMVAHYFPDASYSPPGEQQPEESFQLRAARFA